MKTIAFIKALVCAFLSITGSTVLAQATVVPALNPLVDVRMCGFVPRDNLGHIKRSPAVLAAFQKLHPCPSTGLKSGACPGWSKDHPIPLACGGCDAVYNMAWVPNVAKSCSDWWCKDHYERQIYAADPPVPDSARCKNVVIPYTPVPPSPPSPPLPASASASAPASAPALILPIPVVNTPTLSVSN